MAEKIFRELLNTFGTTEKIVIEGQGYRIDVNELTGSGDLTVGALSIGLSNGDAKLLVDADENGRRALIAGMMQAHEDRKRAAAMKQRTR